MKALFGILLLLNIAALFWYQVWQPARQPGELPLAVPLSSSGASSLQLLRETADAPVVVAADAAAKTPPGCVMLGGYPDLERARLLLRTLRGENAVASLQVLDELQGERFWAYLRPEKGVEAAAFMKRLEASGIETWQVQEGALAPAIMLGVFADQGLLEQSLERLRAMGHAPVVASLPQVRRSFWVELDAVDSASALSRLGSEFSDAKHRVSVCARVAKQI